MKYEFKTSFKRAFKKLPEGDQGSSQIAINTLIDYLDKKIDYPKGLGLKSYGKGYLEIRSNIATRILLKLERELVTFFFVGNHDQIKKFVRNQ